MTSEESSAGRATAQPLLIAFDMLTLRRCLTALCMATALLASGCEVAIRVGAEALADGISKGTGSDIESRGIERVADRPVSPCEHKRGEWREKHQDQDEPPVELRCLDDGSYPPAFFDPNRAVASETPAASSAAPQRAPSAPLTAPATAPASATAATESAPLLMPSPDAL